jgi:hypothetical protein
MPPLLVSAVKPSAKPLANDSKIVRFIASFNASAGKSSM